MLLRRIFIFTIAGVFLSLATESTYAAGIIYRVRQNKMMKQRQEQQQYQQYLLYQQQKEQQQHGRAPQQPQKPQGPLTYQQKVQERNQQISQAIVNANKADVEADNQEALSAVEGSPSTFKSNSGQVKVAGVAQNVVVKEVADLSEVWKKLDKKSTVWTLLMDDQDKVLTVSEYIDRYRKQGVRINQGPSYYVKMVDQMITQNVQMMQRPFGELLQMVAIIDYDFDNGINKDILAKHILGQEAFEANKRRFNP